MEMATLDGDLSNNKEIFLETAPYIESPNEHTYYVGPEIQKESSHVRNCCKLMISIPMAMYVFSPQLLKLFILLF